MNSYNTIETDDLETGLSSVIEDITKRVIPEHEQRGIVFDEVRFEIWEDSGRVIAFSARFPPHLRIDKSGCQLLSQKIAKRIEVLDESGIEDDLFDQAIRSVVLELASVTERVASKELKRPFGIYDQDGERINKPNQSSHTTPASAPR